MIVVRGLLKLFPGFLFQHFENYLPTRGVGARAKLHSFGGLEPDVREEEFDAMDNDPSYRFIEDIAHDTVKNSIRNEYGIEADAAEEGAAKTAKNTHSTPPADGDDGENNGSVNNDNDNDGERGNGNENGGGRGNENGGGRNREGGDGSGNGGSFLEGDDEYSELDGDAAFGGDLDSDAPAYRENAMDYGLGPYSEGDDFEYEQAAEQFFSGKGFQHYIDPQNTQFLSDFPFVVLLLSNIFSIFPFSPLFVPVSFSNFYVFPYPPFFSFPNSSEFFPQPSNLQTTTFTGLRCWSRRLSARGSWMHELRAHSKTSEFYKT